MFHLFLPEEEVFQGPFALVSYSHRDQETVRADINALIDMGARLWIDHRSDDEENMGCGDNWRQKIQNALSHKNCVGAFIYVSGYSLAGKATRWEHNEIFSRTGRITPIAVYMNNQATQNHISAAMNLCLTDPTYLDDLYMLEVGEQVKRFNTNEIIGIFREHTDQSVGALEKEARKLGIISDTLLTAAKINAKKKTVYNTIPFGIYKDTSRQCEEFPDDCTKNTRFKRGAGEYIHSDGTVFCTKPIKWRLLYTKSDNTSVFIACEVLDTCRGNEIGKFLQEFKALAFTEAEATMIKALRVLTNEDLAQIPEEQRPELLLLPPEQHSHSWWIKEVGLLDTWQCLYKNNKPYGLGFLITLKKGLRPVIEINTTDLENFL